ncbi:unnamed protein product [Symbiodinium microadriaticum]|nr:unnamed protein product [Symbiodinium microadriaticum]
MVDNVAADNEDRATLQQAIWFPPFSMQHTVTCDIEIESLLKKADGGVCPPHKCPRPTVLVLSRDVSEEIDDEEWKQRSDKRSKAVAQCKALPEYQRLKRLGSSDEEPRTPNALDRSLSKRRWKFLLQQWRSEIQKLATEHVECNEARAGMLGEASEL